MEFLKAFPIAIIDEDYEGKRAAGPKCSTANLAGSFLSTARRPARNSG